MSQPIDYPKTSNKSSSTIKIYRINEKGQRVLKEEVSPQQYEQMRKSFSKNRQASQKSNQKTYSKFVASPNSKQVISRKTNSQTITKDNNIYVQKYQNTNNRMQNTSNSKSQHQQSRYQQMAKGLDKQNLLENRYTLQNQQKQIDRKFSKSKAEQNGQTQDQRTDSSSLMKNVFEDQLKKYISSPKKTEDAFGANTNARFKRDESGISERRTQKIVSPRSSLFSQTKAKPMRKSLHIPNTTTITKPFLTLLTLFDHFQNRRKSYSFQLIKQFFLFPPSSAESQDHQNSWSSQVTPLNPYDRLLYGPQNLFACIDEALHTLRKIYETKETQTKVWAYLNLKFWPLVKKLVKFTTKIEQVTGRLQGRVRILLKKQSFKQILSFSEDRKRHLELQSSVLPVVNIQNGKNESEEPPSPTKKSQANSSSLANIASNSNISSKSKPGHIYLQSSSSFRIPLSSNTIKQRQTNIENKHVTTNHYNIQDRNRIRVYRLQDSGRKYQSPRKEQKQHVRTSYLTTRPINHYLTNRHSNVIREGLNPNPLPNSRMMYAQHDRNCEYCQNHSSTCNHHIHSHSRNHSRDYHFHKESLQKSNRKCRHCHCSIHNSHIHHTEQDSCEGSSNSCCEDSDNSYGLLRSEYHYFYYGNPHSSTSKVQKDDDSYSHQVDNNDCNICSQNHSQHRSKHYHHKHHHNHHNHNHHDNSQHRHKHRIQHNSNSRSKSKPRISQAQTYLSETPNKNYQKSSIYYNRAADNRNSRQISKQLNINKEIDHKQKDRSVGKPKQQYFYRQRIVQPNQQLLTERDKSLSNRYNEQYRQESGNIDNHHMRQYATQAILVDQSPLVQSRSRRQIESYPNNTKNSNASRKSLTASNQQQLCQHGYKIKKSDHSHITHQNNHKQSGSRLTDSILPQNPIYNNDKQQEIYTIGQRISYMQALEKGAIPFRQSSSPYSRYTDSVRRV